MKSFLSLFIVFLLSFGDLGTTLLVIPPGKETIPIKVYNLTRLKISFHMGIIFVTHNVEEALLFADRIAIMNNGNVVQTGGKNELLNKPKNEFVRRLLRTSRNTYETG